MNEIFEKIYNNNNTNLNEDTVLFEKVYMEVKMLNEMNPKLKALLAAGLIGTAGLGAVSCSMPTDDPYDVQYTIEQPTPENPEEIEEIEDSENLGEITDPEEIEDSGEIEDSEDSENFEDSENPEDSEYTVTFETLGVEEYAESLARAIKRSNTYNVIRKSSKWASYKYENKDTGFNLLKASDFDREGEHYPNGTYIQYKDESTYKLFYVPEGEIEKAFDNAIGAYKAAYHIE